MLCQSNDEQQSLCQRLLLIYAFLSNNPLISLSKQNLTHLCLPSYGTMLSDYFHFENSRIFLQFACLINTLQALADIRNPSTKQLKHSLCVAHIVSSLLTTRTLPSSSGSWYHINCISLFI